MYAVPISYALALNHCKSFLQSVLLDQGLSGAWFYISKSIVGAHGCRAGLSLQNHKKFKRSYVYTSTMQAFPQQPNSSKYISKYLMQGSKILRNSELEHSGHRKQAFHTENSKYKNGPLYYCSYTIRFSALNTH